MLVGAWWLMVRMPGKSYRGPLPPADDGLDRLTSALRRDVERLSVSIGERNLRRYPALAQAADWIEQELTAAGLTVTRQPFTVQALSCHNLEAEIRGTALPGEIVVVGAHYDSAAGTPGANDNATGVAALLELARRFAPQRPARTLRFVAFANEEPPYFQTSAMGSWIYAHGCRKRNENLTAVLSLETIGYFDTRPGTQHYPSPFDLLYPAEGDFIAVVGNVGSRQLVRQVVASFRRHARFPSEGGAVPGMIDGVGWSDHWSFWQEGYSAVMVTDTALFRYPYYHQPNDTPDKINFEYLARVVQGLAEVVADLAGVDGPPPAEQ